MQEEVGLTAEEVAGRPPAAPVNPQGFSSLPRYETRAVVPSAVVENGVVVAWDIPTTMSKDGVVHTLIERYVCNDGERLFPDDKDNGRVIERAMIELVNERGVLERCAAGLEQKLLQSNMEGNDDE